MLSSISHILLPRSVKPFQDPQLRVDLVPIKVRPHDVAGIDLRVGIPRTSMDHPNVTECQDIPRHRLELHSLLMNQLDKSGHCAVPRLNPIQRHVEEAIPLRNAVIDSLEIPVSTNAEMIISNQLSFTSTTIPILTK